MDDKATVINEVCEAVGNGQPDLAAVILLERYPFTPTTNVGRRYSFLQMLTVFAGDGFVDRYSGSRLVFPPTLRLISRRLPEHFPFHRNGRFDACHYGFWELFPTIDHLFPVARGGADDQTNWITTSMIRNAAKSVFTLDELGWQVHPPGNLQEWDGLLGWFTTQVRADRTLLDDGYFRQWFAAAERFQQRQSPGLVGF